MIKKLFLVASVATLTLAQTTSDIALTASYQKFDDNYYLYHHKWYYGLRGGVYFDNGIGVQLGYEQANNANCKGLDLKKTYINALLMQEIQNGIKPYLLATYGYESSSIEDHKPSQNIAGFGVGVRANLNQNIDGFIETKYLKRLDSKDNEFATTLGLAYTFSSIADKLSPDLSNKEDRVERKIVHQKETEQQEIIKRPIIREVEVQDNSDDIFAGRVLHKHSYIDDKAKNSGYFVQLALLSTSNPKPIIKKAKRVGFDNVKTRPKAGATAVVVGPYSTRDKAKRALQALKRVQRGAFITKL